MGGEKKRLRRRLRGYNVQGFENTVSILKRYKGGRIREKMADLSAEIQICSISECVFHGGEHKKPPPVFLKAAPPPEISNRT